MIHNPSVMLLCCIAHRKLIRIDGERMIDVIQTNKGPVEYRSIGSGRVVLVLNGGHTDCRSPFLHEAFFLENGFRVIIPSRPGYGKTPSSSGRTAEAFADTIALFLDALAIDRVVIVGISAGGRTALHFAKNHPARVSHLILESAVTSEPWPDTFTKIGSYLAFNRVTERFTWAILRSIGQTNPDRFLRLLLPALSSRSPEEALAGWNPQEQNAVVAFLLASRSGAGFLLDIRHRFSGYEAIRTPALIIASSNDHSVRPEHSLVAARGIVGAELMMLPALTHLIWFSPFIARIESRISEFLQIDA
jgi:pimeloyl-ACP methyl ester carboxylesterase